MQLMITTDDERVVSIEIDGEEVVDSLKAILEVETGVPMADQAVLYNGALLNDTDKLSSKGVSDGDLLVMHRRPPQQQQNPQGQFGGGGPQQIQELMNKMRNDPNAMAGLEANNPQLASAVKSGDVQTFAAAVQREQERDRQLREEERKLELDPFNAEAQAKIEDIIRQKNVEENFMQAMEHTPEVFGSVTMLYVNIEVNGFPVQAFIDSGAQMTIMTQSSAEQYGLMRLVDKRFAGMAVGVGSSKIIGRVHQCPLKVKGSFITSSVTILEQKTGPQFIFGLDNLFRHQCCIDLKAKVLRFGTCNAELDFLAEHEIVRKDDFESMAPSDAQPDQPGASGATESAPAPPAAPPTNTTTTATPPSSGGFPEAKIKSLMDLGFDREKCVQALTISDGNEETAASFLFGGF
ncbi:hypothetical protein BSKO_03135 [Bryopsis sp. KO-2023]|nr:hypothetical protein BSKO_03135 [Bryopsis sp. KO-2023]